MLRFLLAAGSLNIVQGLPSYFFLIAVPALLRESGASLQVVGLTYVVWLPWALKWLWAPLFDKATLRPFGDRTGWLRALPVAMAISFVAVAFVPPATGPWPLLALALVSAILGATLQVVLGAWVIETVPEVRRGWANAAQVSGMTLGGILGGSVILLLSDRLGWDVTIYIVAAGILLASLPAWWVAASPGAAQGVARLGAWSELRAVVLRPAFRHLGAVIMVVAVAGGSDALLAAFLIDQGLAAARVGLLLGVVAMAAILPASAFVGWSVQRFGIAPVLASILCFKAVMLLSLAVTATGAELPPLALEALAVATFMLTGATMVVMWQAYMSVAAEGHAATDFSVLTSIEAFLLLVAGIGAGQVAGLIGYTSLFLGAASFAVLGAVLALLLLSRRAALAATVREPA